MEVETFILYEQFFLVATKHQDFPEEASGSLGLADSKNNSEKHNFIKNLWEKGLIKSPLFSITLASDYKKRDDSVLTIGDYDFKRYSNEIKTSIYSDSTWLVSVASFDLDSVTKSSRNVPVHLFLLLMLLCYHQLNMKFY